VWVQRTGPDGTTGRRDDGTTAELVPSSRRPVVPSSLREGFAEAGGALAALTRRTAEEAAGRGRLLLPDVAVPDPWPAVAALPLGGARQGLAEGLEPVTTSARRAVSLFLRDLPLAEE